MSPSPLSAEPLITVITPAFNCGPYIRACIESVLSQNYPKFEHIVIDGASTDNTVEILKQYPHVRFISEPDTGEANALNKSLPMIKGEIVSWLNADDIFTEGTFHAVLKEFAKHDELCVVYGDIDYIDEEGKFLFDQKSSPVCNLPVVIRWWKNVLHPHQPSIFYPKAVMNAVGKFREDLFFAIDHDYLLRTVVRFPFYYVHKVVARQRLRANCKSALAGEDCHNIHRTISLSYANRLSFVEQITFWFDYHIQHSLPLPSELKMKAGIRTRLKRLLKV